MEMDYVKLTADELARDLSFRKWILQPSPGVNHFWQRFLLLHPTQKQKMQQARDLLELSYGFPAAQLDPLRKDEIHCQIIARIVEDRRRKIKIRILASVAAVLILFVIVFDYSLPGDHFVDPETLYTAGFGERQKIVLPDGSLVDLNANSTLKLGKGWGQGIREVWLEGEAFFEVEKYGSQRSKFTVHTHGPDVEVVGTHFNVDSRNENTRIYLEEGKVCLLIKDASDAYKEVFLDPGELACFTKSDYYITRQNDKQVQSLVSWKTGYLLYDNTSLSEVIEDITFAYGKTVKVADEDLLSRKINGAIPTNNLAEFIKVTELLFGVHAKVEESLILFENN